MEKKLSKREMILDVALTLFAEKGYDRVGVDEIAAALDMKGPALYYYFKGKDAILDAILEQAEVHYSGNMGSEANPGRVPASVDELVEVSMGRIRFTLHDPVVHKVRRILMMEQYRSSRIAKLATLHNLTMMCAVNEKILAVMMENGTIRRTDPKALALMYTAPVSLLVQRFDREPEAEEEILQQIEAHFRFFAQEYRP